MRDIHRDTVEIWEIQARLARVDLMDWLLVEGCKPDYTLGESLWIGRSEAAAARIAAARIAARQQRG